MAKRQQYAPHLLTAREVAERNADLFDPELVYRFMVSAPATWEANRAAGLLYQRAQGRPSPGPNRAQRRTESKRRKR